MISGPCVLTGVKHLSIYLCIPVALPLQFRLICLPNPPAYKYTATPTVNGVSRSSVITSPMTLRPCTSVPLSPFPRSVRFLSFPASAFGRAFVKFPFVALNRRDTSCGACCRAFFVYFLFFFSLFLFFFFWTDCVSSKGEMSDDRANTFFDSW